jgi:hypothetical protein
MATIYWSGFTWEAFATLATGFLAVAAAYSVGRRQVKIARKQTEILDRQVALDELKLRSELFDRRFAIYEGTKRLLAAVMAHDEKADDETVRAFLIALDQSVFLFQPNVYERLKVIWDLYCKYGAIKSAMKHNYETTKQYGDEQLINAHTQHLLAFNDTLTNLRETFGDELRLGQDRRSLTPKAK